MACMALLCLHRLRSKGEVPKDRETFPRGETEEVSEGCASLPFKRFPVSPWNDQSATKQ